MAKKKNGSTHAAQATHAVPTNSIIEPGNGTANTSRRLIIIYGLPKVRKTTSVSKLFGRRVKWLVSDSNCLPTLESVNRKPHPSDIYRVRTLQEAKDFLQKILNAAEEHGVEKLGFDILAVDSLTRFFDWHKEEIARITGQRFMGDNKENNGWQQFNAEYGTFLDMLAQVAELVLVIAIGHSLPKPSGDKALDAFKKKGEWAALNLSPAMAEKSARLANWILYQTLDTRYVDSSEPGALESDAFITAEQLPNGTIKHIEVVIHTTPYDAGGYTFSASVNSKLNENEKPTLEAEEPGDLDYILVKEGLLEPRT